MDDFAKFQSQHLVLFGDLTPQILLLNDLCHQYPTGYVEFKDIDYFYPVRIELYKFDYFNKILEVRKNGSFLVKSHNSLPIVLSRETIETREAFIIFNLQLITGITPKIVCTEKDINWNIFIEYLRLLDYVMNSDQMAILIKNILVNVDINIFISLLEHDIDLKKFLSYDRKIQLCEEYYIMFNPYTEQTIPTDNLCKFGDRCRSFTNYKFICNRYHYRDSKLLEPILNKKNFLLVQQFLNDFGFIFIDSFARFMKLYTKNIYPRWSSMNWDMKFYCVKTSMLFSITYCGTGKFTFVILENHQPYDFETNKNKICPSLDGLNTNKRICYEYDEPHYCCEKVSDFDISVDGYSEKFFCLMIWEKYKCGYGCNTNIYHPHGN